MFKYLMELDLKVKNLKNQFSEDKEIFSIILKNYISKRYKLMEQKDKINNTFLAMKFFGFF